MDLKENFEALYNTMQFNPIQPSLYYPFADPMVPYVPPCYAMEINGARRKNATRETTSTLKAWLNEHRKNPYPTKGEKIMLAICTKMTLTQVSTWFANARRRLKKENKMTWSPRNRCDEDDDFIDDEPLANSTNDKCSSRSASVSSVQQQNNILQIKNESQTALHHSNGQSNQHSSSSATNNLDNLSTHPIVPFGLPNLPNGLTNLSNGLSNSTALAQQQLAAAIAAANPLPPQLAQLTPQQQQLLLGSDPQSMAALMQQQLALHHHHQQQLQQHQLNLNNNINKKIEEDSSEIVDIEDNSNLGSLSDSDSINPSAIHQQFNRLASGPPTLASSNHHNHSNNHQNNHSNNHSNNHPNNHSNNHPNNHSNKQPPNHLNQHTPVSQSAASLLHQSSQNSSHLSNLHSQLANSGINASTIFNAASTAAILAAQNHLMSKSTAASLQQANIKPRIWSIVDIATNNSAVAAAAAAATAATNRLLETSSHLSKDTVKLEKKPENTSPILKPSNSPSTGISINSPSTTSIPTTTTNVTSIKKEP